jgi:hypothetical protein
MDTMAALATQEIQKTRKLTLNLPQSVIEKVAWLADRLSLTQTQVIRESIEVRYQLQKEIDAGGTVLIERPGGEIVKIWVTGSS